jgi:hypothetical protein
MLKGSETKSIGIGDDVVSVQTVAVWNLLQLYVSCKNVFDGQPLR